MTKTFNVHDASPQLVELLSQVAAGHDVVIVSGGTPVARLVPVEKTKSKRVLGTGPGKAWIADDFDAPLPDEFWLGEK